MRSRLTPDLWLGSRRGYFSDWVTQRWVKATGRRVDLTRDPWLAGPVGPTTKIGRDYFENIARFEGLEIRRTGVRGLLGDFAALRGPSFDPDQVHPSVVAFYEQTSAYDLDAWAQWSGTFRPFGSLLAFLFSRRLQQLNVPLSALDTSRGVTSEVLHLADPATGTIRYTAWGRQLRSTGDVLYAGSYSVCRVPGCSDPCIKVVFPLPNGNAIVIMKTQAHSDGSFSVISAGRGFGEPGFYFTVHGDGAVWARYVRALRETIQVWPAESGVVRADHVLALAGATFLRLHYRLTRPPYPVKPSVPIGLSEHRST